MRLLMAGVPQMWPCQRRARTRIVHVYRHRIEAIRRPHVRYAAGGAGLGMLPADEEDGKDTVVAEQIPADNTEDKTAEASETQSDAAEEPGAEKEPVARAERSARAAGVDVTVRAKSSKPAKHAKGKQPARAGFSVREKVLVCVAAVLAIVAIAGFVMFANATPGDDVAASVNGTAIAEEDVATWIAQYRASYSLSDDDDFADYLNSSSTTVSSVRITAIDQLALNMLILERAEELGVTPTEAEAQEQLEAVKESMSLGDDEVWAETLEEYALTEEDLLEQYTVNLAQEAICEADVDLRDATDDELLSYMQSYLAGSTQYHAYRIMFTGDDASDEVYEVYELLETMQDDGELTVETFSTMAVQYSDEETVAETGGSYAWSGSEMADEVKDAIEDATVGALVSVEYVEDDAAYEIIYCDTSYSFADSDSLTELPDDVPDALMAEIEDAAAEVVYDTNCSDYLAWMLAQAKITYYPMPDDAAYNVNLSAGISDDADDDESDADDEDADEEDADETDSADEDEADEE